MNINTVSVFILLTSLGLMLSCQPGPVANVVSKETNIPLISTANNKPAWEAEWENVLALAQKERRLVLYSTGTSSYAGPAQKK